MSEPSITDIDGLAGDAARPLVPELWSAAAVRLLQGVVYHDDHPEVWDSLLKSVSILTDYFAKLGLVLVVDEVDGMAFLRQLNDDEAEAGPGQLPRLFRRTPLGFDASLLCVLLRDELRRWEEQDVQNQRCVIAQLELLSTWQAFFGDHSDAVRHQRTLVAALRKLEELKFVKLFEKDPPSWEIRRILKARLPLAELERWKQTLQAAVQQSAVGDIAEASETDDDAPSESNAGRDD